MKNRIYCGKVDWSMRGNDDHTVMIEVELKDVDGHREFSTSCWIYNKNGELVSGGQVFDRLFLFDKMAPFKPIYLLWKKWHMNGKTAGSPKQEAALRRWRKKQAKLGMLKCEDDSDCEDYEAECAVLRRCGLYVDKSFMHNGKPYEYGTDWLVREIPPDDIAEIMKWLKTKYNPNNIATEDRR